MKHNIDLIVIVIALAAFVVAAHAIRVPGASDANAVYDTPPYESRYPYLQAGGQEHTRRPAH